MREITTLDELKAIELSIMKKIHNFCVANNITYYLYAGTLIGAVRHKGFIPWDDDIDIAMPRQDYEKFLDIFPKYAEENDLQLVNYKTKPYYPRPFTKVINSNTVLYDLDFKATDPIGVFVDIWPLDGLPNEEKKRGKHIRRIRFLNRLLYAKVTRVKRTNSFKRNFRIIGGHILACCISLNKLLDKIVKVSKKFSYENSVFVCGTADYIIAEKREYWGEPKLLDFEDTQFNVPQNYDKVLRAVYGNYMGLPPENKRIPHHIVNTYWKD